MSIVPKSTCHRYGYQIWDACQGDRPFRIHLIGYRDHDHAGNNFSTIEEAQEEALRRNRLQQQTGLGYAVML